MAELNAHNPSMTVLVIAANVRAEVARFGLQDAVFAADMGMTPMSMSRRLNGHTPFTTSELDTISRYFGVPVGDFFSPRPNRRLAAIPETDAVETAGANPRQKD